jgi:hypothetical protein
MKKTIEVVQGEERRVVAIAPGVCRHCGCSDSNTCRLVDSESCCWMDRKRTVCSNPSCVKAEASRRRAAVACRPRRLTSADVHALIRGRKRSCKAARPRGVYGKEGGAI